MKNEWNIFDISIKPKKNDNFKIAKFRLAVPKNIKEIKSVLSLNAGINHDGRDWWEDEHWKDFAIKNSCAIFCPYFHTQDSFNYFNYIEGENAANEHYVAAKNGSGKAYFSALDKLLKKSKIKNGDQLPIYLFGHSAGGIFNYNLTLYKSERIAAFTVNKAAEVYPLPSDELLNKPGIFFIGGQDLKRRNGNIETIYNYRKEDSPWVLINENNQAHDLGMSEYFAQSFFERIMKQTNK